LGLFDDLFSSENEYGTQSVTLDGIKVKSKAEKYVADYFCRNNIRYQYEKPAESHFWIFSNKISKPDFYLMDYDVYVEYWGLLDADKRSVSRDYERTMKWKIAMYHKHKIKFISIYPSNLENLDWIFKKKLKDVCGAIIPSSQTTPQRVIPQKTFNCAVQQTTVVRNYCAQCGGRVSPNDVFCSKCGLRLT
jgi:hypothetical protein